MAAEQSSIHGLWRNRWLFILAATGSAVGFGEYLEISIHHG